MGIVYLVGESFKIGSDLDTFYDWFLEDEDLAPYFLVIANLHNNMELLSYGRLRECVIATVLREIMVITSKKFRSFPKEIIDPEWNISERPSDDLLLDYSKLNWIRDAFTGYLNHVCYLESMKADVKYPDGALNVYSYTRSGYKSLMVYETQDNKLHYRYDGKFADESFGSTDPAAVAESFVDKARELISSYKGVSSN